jgi:hypothetical protein
MVLAGSSRTIYPLARSRIADARQYEVSVVERFAFDIHLRGEPVEAAPGEREVDVWCASGIGNGPYRAKTVKSFPVGNDRAVPLEIRIGAAAIARMVITAQGVALPDLDARARNRPAAAVQNSPDHVCDRTLSWPSTAGDGS